MNIDVLIPVYKPDEKFKQLLNGLSNQTICPQNIIIMYTCLNNEDHLSKDYINAYTGGAKVCIHELSVESFDHGATRAEGMSYSLADVVVCMTMDAVPYDEYMLENLVIDFDKKEIVAAYARQMAADNSTLAEHFTRGFNYPDKSVIKSMEDLDSMGIKTFFCSNVCAAYKRDIYNELGGFVKKTIFNEDMIYAYAVIKNGYKIRYASEAKVIHTHNYTAMQQFHRNFDLAVSQAMYSEVFSGISSESEGVKYVREAYRYFKDRKRSYLIIPFIYGCCFKYLGYLLGKRYKKLPMWMINYCTMNKNFFKDGKYVRTE